jgi:hypothetical protein
MIALLILLWNKMKMSRQGAILNHNECEAASFNCSQELVFTCECKFYAIIDIYFRFWMLPECFPFVELRCDSTKSTSANNNLVWSPGVLIKCHITKKILQAYCLMIVYVPKPTREYKKRIFELANIERNRDFFIPFIQNIQY